MIYDYCEKTDHELSSEETMARVLRVYKQGLEPARYRSFRYRVLALAGYREAQQDRNAFRAGEQVAVRYVNSSPERQAVWRRLSAAEPDLSPAKRFLPRVLRPNCTPLPELPPEEQQQRRAEARFLQQRMQHLLAQLDEAGESLRKQERDGK